LIQVETILPNTLVTGQPVVITGVSPNTGVDRPYWVATVVDNRHFTLNGSKFVTAAGAGGDVFMNDPSAVGGESALVADNVLMRTLPAVTAYADWGYDPKGLWECAQKAVVTCGFYTGPVPEQALLADGIQIEGALRNTRIAGNVISIAQQSGDPTNSCIRFTDQHPQNNDYDGVTIDGNRCDGFGRAGVNFDTQDRVNQRVSVVNNDFDGDPGFTSSMRGGNGTWQTGGPPNAVVMHNVSGWTLEANHVRNVAGVAGSKDSGVGLIRSNVLFGNPAVVGGFSPANVGIGNAPRSAGGSDYLWVIEDDNPNSATYGRVISAPTLSASARPDTGKHVEGEFVANVAPRVQGDGRLVLGWQRLSTGSGNAEGADWATLYADSGKFSGSTPTVMAGRGDCGTAPGIVGNNLVGRVTVGTAENGGKCTLRFAETFGNPPVCTVANETSSIRGVTPMPTNTGLTIAATTSLAPGDRLSYHCTAF
jgi:hypothetical protein